MDTKELYELAGEPKRARIILSEPTKVYTGLRRASVVEEFEAYITRTAGGEIGYYINPNARRAFYMPENVIRFVSIDTMELWYRAKKAADHIKAGRIYGRELDNAFENNDGEEMCAALYRMSLKSKKLSETLYKALVKEHVQECSEKFAHLNDKELSEHARKSRGI